MESYCLKCRKYTKNINPQVLSTSNGKIMIWSKCAICGCKKSKFIKQQESKELLSKLGIKTPWSKILDTGWYFILNAYKKWMK